LLSKIGAAQASVATDHAGSNAAGNIKIKSQKAKVKTQ